MSHSLPFFRFFFFFFFLLKSFLPLAAQHLAETGEKNISSIEALSYCEFLNSEAAVDSEHFFEEKMTGDATSACVKRSGAPGSYHYEVMAGQEDIRVSYLSRAAATAYAQWKERGDDLLRLTEANNSDPELKSNLSFFELISNQTAMASASDATDSWSWENLSWEEKALVGISAFSIIDIIHQRTSTARAMRLVEERRQTAEAALAALTHENANQVDALRRMGEEHQQAMEERDARETEAMRLAHGELPEAILVPNWMQADPERMDASLQIVVERELRGMSAQHQQELQEMRAQHQRVEEEWKAKNTTLLEAQQREKEEHQRELDKKVEELEEWESTCLSLCQRIKKANVLGEAKEFVKMRALLEKRIQDNSPFMGVGIDMDSSTMGDSSLELDEHPERKEAYKLNDSVHLEVSHHGVPPVNMELSCLHSDLEVSQLTEQTEKGAQEEDLSSSSFSYPFAIRGSLPQEIPKLDVKASQERPFAQASAPVEEVVRSFGDLLSSAASSFIEEGLAKSIFPRSKGIDQNVEDGKAKSPVEEEAPSESSLMENEGKEEPALASSPLESSQEVPPFPIEESLK